MGDPLVRAEQPLHQGGERLGHARVMERAEAAGTESRAIGIADARRWSRARRRDQLEEHQPDRIQVRALVERAPFDLLGRHVQRVPAPLQSAAANLRDRHAQTPRRSP